MAFPGHSWRDSGLRYRYRTAPAVPTPRTETGQRSPNHYAAQHCKATSQADCTDGHGWPVTLLITSIVGTRTHIGQLLNSQRHVVSRKNNGQRPILCTSQHSWCTSTINKPTSNTAAAATPYWPLPRTLYAHRLPHGQKKSQQDWYRSNRSPN